MDIVINQYNLDSIHQHKCKFAAKSIQLVITSNSSCTEMPALPTLCIMGELDWSVKSFQLHYSNIDLLSRQIYGCR